MSRRIGKKQKTKANKVQSRNLKLKESDGSNNGRESWPGQETDIQSKTIVDSQRSDGLDVLSQCLEEYRNELE